MWKPNKKGIWTAQSAYKLLQRETIESTLSELNRSNHTMAVINSIWKNKQILPRVQMFIWRFLTKSLNAQRMHRRIKI